MKFDRRMLLLYGVTHRAWMGEYTLLEQIELALKGGVTMLQLREKGLDEDSFLQEAIQVSQLCRGYHVPLILNDNVEVALRSGADGVHLGQGDAPVAEVRRRVPGDFIIGATCKSVEQARVAQASGADYMGVGAVFPSPTKADAIPVTRERLREIVAAVCLPAVAIGGVNRDNIPQLQGSGIAGVAVISSLFGAENISLAAAQLRESAKAVAAP